MIRVIKSLVSGCKLPTGCCPIPYLNFVLWTFLINTHLQGGTTVDTGIVIQHFYAEVYRWAVCSFTFIWSIFLCNIATIITGLGNSMFHSDNQDNQWFMILAGALQYCSCDSWIYQIKVVWKLATIAFLGNETWWCHYVYHFVKCY